MQAEADDTMEITFTYGRKSPLWCPTCEKVGLVKVFPPKTRGENPQQL